MNKILAVAKREYIETARTKIFLFGVFLTPVLMCGIIFFMHKMQHRIEHGPTSAQAIAILDLSGEVAQDLSQAFREYNKANPQRVMTPTIYEADKSGGVEQLKRKVREGKFAACLVVNEAVLTGTEPSRLLMKAKKISDMQTFQAVRRLLRDAVVNARIRQRNLSPDIADEIRRPVPVAQVDVTEETDRLGPPIARIMTPAFLLFLMFLGILGTSQGMLTSVIEEKNSRVIEVLLSALSPFQLMAGKILGLGAIGLTVVLIWGVVAYGVALSQGWGNLFSTVGLGYFLCYFVLGFLMFSSLFAAIGAACNTLKEAQGLMTPLMILITLPLAAWFYIVQYPDGPLAISLSFIPPTAPMIMITRLAAQPDLSIFQIIMSLVVLALSVPAIMWAAAKIFRTGILMYGKQPSLWELLRWIRLH